MLAYLHIRRLYRLLSVIIFYFNHDEIRYNATIQPQFTQIKHQLEEIIDALSQNLKRYYLLKHLIKNITSETPNQNEYKHYQNLSIQTITDIIQIEINVITINLVKLFKSRQTQQLLLLILGLNIYIST